jgi:hypothetical protein
VHVVIKNSHYFSVISLERIFIEGFEEKAVEFFEDAWVSTRLISDLSFLRFVFPQKTTTPGDQAINWWIIDPQNGRSVLS